MYIDANFIIRTAALLGALSAIGAMFYKMMKFIDNQKEQDNKIAELREEHQKDIKLIQKEQCVMCHALLAALDGLKQLGANDNVSDAYEELEKHLNEQAHE